MLNRAALLAGFAALSLAAPIAAAPGMTAQQLLTRARAASGGAAWDGVRTLHFSGTMAVSGLTGTLEAREDLAEGRSVEAFDLGVISGSQGFDGALAWSADAAGIVNPQDAPAARRRAATNAYRVARAYLRPDFGGAEVEYLRAESEGAGRFAVLAVTPPAGDRFELWVDAASGLADRFVDKGDTEVETTRLSDYRRVNGLMLPHHVASGPAGSETVTKIDGYRINAALPVDGFARPASRIQDARLAGGTADIPVRIDNGHVIVDVAVNGAEPLPFVLDSGASTNLLTPEGAAALGVVGQGKVDVQGAGEGSVEAQLTRVRRIAVGPAELDNQQFVIMPLPALITQAGKGRKPVAGIIGYDLFRRFATTIDYEQGRLRLADFRPCPATLAPDQLKLGFGSRRLPEIVASIDGVEGHWTIDTGAGGSTALFPPFARKHGLDRTPFIAMNTPGGVGGAVRQHLIRRASLTIGPHRLDAPYLGLTQQESGAFASTVLAGNLGYQVLRNFTVGFDYECRTVRFTPNGNYGSAEPVNRSGMTFTKASAEAPLSVLDVVPAGAAVAAGIKPGDALAAIDGIPAGELSYGEIMNRLKRAPDTRVSLALIRDGKPFKAELRLAEPLPAPRLASN